MVGKTAPIRNKDRIRFQVIREHTGCICCLIELRDAGYEEISLTTIEHVTDRGRRLEDEHQATIGLCPWHHLGVPWSGMQSRDMTGTLGPSLANGRRPFEEHYGDEVHVLLPLQDELIIMFAADPWPAYTVPRSVRQAVRRLWTKLKKSE